MGSAAELQDACRELLPGYGWALREPERWALLTRGCLARRPIDRTGEAAPPAAERFDELANEVYTPAPRLVERTRRIIEAMREAATEGKGAVSLDGRLIDAASIRMAENLLAKLEQIEARDPVAVAPEPAPPAEAVV